MLQVKLKSSSNKKKEEAMREVSKLDNDKVIFARITSKEMKKVRHVLLEREMTIVEWIKEKIAEL